MDTNPSSKGRAVVQMLEVAPLSPAAFASFGEVIEPWEDKDDAAEPSAPRLELSHGTPRLYIMRLHARGLIFRTITRHRRVTQCLAAMGGKDWYIAVAAPRDPDDPDERPLPSEIRGFRIPGTAAIKLHRGTWHAGPFFEEDRIDFLNLELDDTNRADHQDCDLDVLYGRVLRFAV